MSSNWSRRAAVRAGAVLFASAGAGCSGLGLGGSGDDPVSDSDPDKGRGSYGIRIVNRTDSERTVRGIVERPFEDQRLFDKAPTLQPDTVAEWDTVLTEEVEYAVVGKMDVPEKYNDAINDYGTSQMWVTVGNENEPEAANVVVEATTFTTGDGPNSETIPTVNVKWPEAFRTEEAPE